MAINFPSTPQLNDSITVGSTKYIWDGIKWTALNTDSFLGPGAIGVTVQGYDADTAKLDVAQSWLAAQTFRQAASQDGILLRGRAGGSGNYSVEIVPAALSASRTLTAPDVSGTLITTGDTGTVTSTMLAGSIGNAKLSNSSVTINSAATALGGSVTLYAGTTALQTSSANQNLSGISSIALPGASSGTVTITPAATAGTTAITLPATSGTLITSGDSGTVTSTMLAGSIADSKLSTISTAGKVSGGAITSGTIGGSTAVNTSGSIATSSSISDAAGDVRTLPQNSQSSGYTLVAADTGKHISITTGGVTVPASVFSAGAVVTIYNNSGSNQTITQGSSVTLRQAGTANTGNRTLAQYGVATVLCVASNTFVISGSGLS